ncbi:hypothetical protein TCAL_15843, partial [Tigriopus californicus]
MRARASFGKAAAGFIREMQVELVTREDNPLFHPKHEREKGTATELVCPHCAHVCLGESQYTNHIKRRHRPYQCTQCVEVCVGKLLLNKHNSEVHGANRCDICAMCFSTNYLLRTHKRIHLEPSFACQFCPKMFKSDRCKATHER